MTTTIREFQRQFSKMRLKARAGERIIVRDAEGVAYAFQALPESQPIWAEEASDLAGSYHSGRGDLSSNLQHLAGYGR